MSIVWSVQILASLALKYTKKLENSENRGMETVRKISNFLALVFITQYVKNGQSFRKIYFSISKPYWKVSDFLRE